MNLPPVIENAVGKARHKGIVGLFVLLITICGGAYVLLSCAGCQCLLESQ